MSHVAEAAPDPRRFPRLKLPPMYTLIRVKPHGDEAYLWTGHIYDVSESGIRFELDQSLAPGTRVDVRAMLPGARHATFEATGRVVRIHDEWDHFGPSRMGLIIEQFSDTDSEEQLKSYLGQSMPMAA